MRHVTLAAAALWGALSLAAGTAHALPEYFSLIAPGTPEQPGNVISDPASIEEFSWSPSAGAASYIFYLSYPVSEARWFEREGITPEELGCDSGTCRFDAALLDVPITAKGNYTWWVRAVDADGQTLVDDSYGYVFRVGSPDMPGEFNLLAPATGAGAGFTVFDDPAAVTAFEWSASARAESYRLWLVYPAFLRPGRPPLEEYADLRPGVQLECDEARCRWPVDGATLLGQDGLYAWTVVAENAEGTAGATNRFQYFSIDSPLGDFDLQAPAYDTRFTEAPPADLAFRWQEPADAVSYRFLLERFDSDNSLYTVVRDEPGLANGDQVNCVDGSCSYAVDASSLAEGTYVWTVFATAAGGQSALPGNRQWRFVVDYNAVANEGFESARAGAPARWVASNLTRDRVVCTSGVAYSGDCVFRFLGGAGENSRITQYIRDPAARGFVAGQTLALRANVFARNLAQGAFVRLSLRYTDGSREDVRLRIPRSTAGGYRQIGQEAIPIARDLESVRIVVGYANGNASGEFRVDDLWLGLSSLASARAMSPR